MDVLVTNRKAISNMIKASKPQTFDDYAHLVLIFCLYIMKHLKIVTTLDVVLDAYIDNSSKVATKSKRGKEYEAESMVKKVYQTG